MTKPPVCPQCGHPIKDEGMMSSCLNCGAFVMLDGGETPSPPATDTQAPPESLELSLSSPSDSASTEPIANSLPEEPAAPAIGEIESQEILGAAEPPPEVPQSQFGTDQAPSPPLIEEPPAEEFNMDALLSGMPEHVEEPPAVVEFGQAGDPLGINDFANSEMSQAKDGLFYYKILISGIDSKEMRDSLREVIEDLRFGWNPSELMKRIHRGQLTIDKVAPIKATVLVNQIKRLPLEIRWEQYDITQTDGP